MRRVLTCATLVSLLGVLSLTAAAAQGPAWTTLTVHQADVQCRTQNAAPGSGSPVIVYGYYVKSPANRAGYLLGAPGPFPVLGTQRAQDVKVNGLVGFRTPTDRTWVDVYGVLQCGVGNGDILPGIDASRWTRAGPHPPMLQVFLTVKPPSVLRAHRDAVFGVGVRFGSPLVPQAYYVDFRLAGSWAKPAIKTPDGSQACGGDNIPRQPTESRGYWRLDFGDCRTIDLVVRPNAAGRHALVIRPFRVPLNDRGLPIFARRVLEPNHEYRWRGTVTR